jgi:transposase
VEVGPLSERTRFLGLDVHKETIAVAIADEGSQPQIHSTIRNEPGAVRSLVKALKGPGVRLVAAYEAGPTGYTLHRQLTRLGVESQVIAPSLTPRPKGNRVKNDRRDALLLARLLRSGDLTPIWIPDEAHEALRDLVRARADAKADQLRARHRLSKFLLRKDSRPPAGARAWSVKHQDWLRHLTFEHEPETVVFRDYCQQVEAAGERVKRLEAELRHCAESSPHLPLIAALQSMRGIAFLTAVTIVTEAGDLRRFKAARQFMGYTGLVPSEHSSGGSTHRGPITHTGNGPLRHVLVEAAHHARHAPRVEAALKQRQAGVPPRIVDISWKAQQRLNLRYRHLSARLGRPKAITAVARELAGFVWALGQEMEAPAA